MSLSPDLETLRLIFQDKRVWFAVGVIEMKEFVTDMSVLRVKVKLFPDSHQVVARVAWNAVGPEAGNFGPISVGDMALVALSEGSEDHCYVVSMLSSREEKIPEQVKENHTISKSLPGKRNIVWGDTKLNLVSPTRINIAKSDADVTEPLVLGNVAKAYHDQIHQIWDQAPQIGFDSFGLPVFLDPTVKLQLLQAQLIYLTTVATNILSQLSFTERGT